MNLNIAWANVPEWVSVLIGAGTMMVSGPLILWGFVVLGRHFGAYAPLIVLFGLGVVFLVVGLAALARIMRTHRETHGEHRRVRR